jgi:hypothetical protein
MRNAYPFMSLRLPRRMWSTPFFQTAKKNTRKLISHLDTYNTIKQFLYFNKYKKLLEKPFDSQFRKCREYFSKSEPKIRSLRGVSLFENIPSRRTCRDAMAPLVYCTCNHQVDITQDETQFIKESKLSFNDTALLIVQKLNSIADEYRKKCQPFEFKSIRTIKRLTIDKQLIYKFSLVTTPADAEFDSFFKPVNATTVELVGKIIRTSLYGRQSECIFDPKLYGFCYCN